MRSIKKLAILLLAVAATGIFAAKPVGILNGNSYKRLGELTGVTIFNPQWSKDKPLTTVVTAKNLAASLDKISVLVYIHGNNIFRFREFTAPVAAKVEDFVRKGGIFVILVDGGHSSGVTKTGVMANLLGAKGYSVLNGKPEIIDPAWKACGKIPEVFEHMLAPVDKNVKVKMTALTGLTTAKPIIGNKSGYTVTVNQLGAGKVYFINIRLSESYTKYQQPYHSRANAAWEQYLPFAKMIHAAIMEAKPALSKEKRGIWDPQPLGPKCKPLNTKKRESKPLVSARKFQKLEGNELALVVDGKPQALLVARRVGERGAFDTLNNLLFKMSGVKLYQPNPKAVSEKNGAWSWQRKNFATKIIFEVADHVSIKAQGNLITITAPNPSLGIHTFMREALGYRMLWPGKTGEVYTKTSTVKVAPFDLYDKTPIRQRNIRNGLSCGKYPWKDPQGNIQQINMRDGGTKTCDILGLDPIAAIKARSAHYSWFGPQRLGGGLKEGGGTNFYNWQTRFGKTHPEYLALQFETNRKMKSKHVRVCKSNPKVIKQAVADALENLKKPRNKDVEYYRFSPSDGGYDIWCMCENCRKWDPQDAPRITSRAYIGQNRPVFPYVHMTDRVLRFTCEAARELQKHKPNMKVVFLAYSSYRFPPRYYHDFPNNLLVTFVEGGYLNNIDIKRAKEYWDFWASRVSELCWRPNFLGTGAGMPFIYTKLMANDLKYFAANGMVGGDFDTLPHHWATQSLNYYVLANLLWDPATPLEDLINDFCQKGFGAGADKMKEYYAHCEKLTDVYRNFGGVSVEDHEDLTKVPVHGYGKFCRVFNAEEIKKLEALLDGARKKVAADSMERQRIDFVAAGLKFFKLNNEFAQKYYNTPAKERKKLVPEIDALINEWKAIFKEHPFAINLTGIGTNYFYEFFRNCGWKPVREYKK